MFVISHRNHNSSLYGIANGGKSRRRRENETRGRRREKSLCLRGTTQYYLYRKKV